MSYNKLPELPKNIPLDTWLGPSEELVYLRKYKEINQKFFQWLFDEVLTDKQLDTELGFDVDMAHEKTIKGYLRGMLIK